MKSATKPKANTEPRAKLAFEAIGTAWLIEFAASAEEAKRLAKLIADRISEFDKNYSRFRPDSWVTHVGQTPGRYKVPSDFAPMFRLYKQMYEATNGLVTPLIGDALERAGYDAKYSLQPKPLRAIPELAKTLDFQGDTLHVKYQCVIDFGAAGKGYLVDLVGQLLKEQGITEFFIDAGGDMLFSPAPGKTTSVALEDPDDPSQAIGQITIRGGSLCGSAGNRRKWDKFHHIINPKTLKSVNDIKAVWVTAESAMLADGLATCLFFNSPDKLKFEFEYLIIYADRSAKLSAKFPGSLF